MSGGITKRKRSDGTVFYRARIYAEGRTVSLGSFETEADALAVLEAARAQLGITMDLPGTRTLRDWGGAWLDARERSGRIRGIRQERSVWNARVRESPMAALPMKQITRAMVARWVTAIVESGRSPQTAKHALRLVRSCLRAAADEGQVETNVAVAVKVPRIVESEATPKWAWLTAEEISILLAAEVPQWARDIWTVAIYTGLRKGELAGLRWSDVHLEGDRPRLVVVRSYRATTKSGKGREVPLLPPALAALHRVQARTPGIGARPVWPSHSNGVRSKDWDPGGWRRYAMGATRPLIGPLLARHIRFHDLRHTCASHLVQGTWLARPMSLNRVKQWLGHSSISVTERYAHLAPGGLHDLAAEWTDPRPTRRPKSGESK